MFRKTIAATFVAFWLVLLGIEFSEDSGLIEYANPETDKSVEATLASLGKAIKIFDDGQGALRTLAAHPTALYPAYSIPKQIVLCLRLGKEAKFLREGIPIYKRQCVFLI
ncbi:MAG: hypothetical protein ACE5JU_13685 [Candidatus Binatia bacterium]